MKKDNTNFVIQYDKMRNVYILKSVIKKNGREYTNFVAESENEQAIENMKKRMEGMC